VSGIGFVLRPVGCRSVSRYRMDAMILGYHPLLTPFRFRDIRREALGQQDVGHSVVVPQDVVFLD